MIYYANAYYFYDTHQSNDIIQDAIPTHIPVCIIQRPTMSCMANKTVTYGLYKLSFNHIHV